MSALISKHLIIFLDEHSPVKVIVRGEDRLHIVLGSDVDLELDSPEELDAEFEQLVKQVKDKMLADNPQATGYYTLVVISETLDSLGSVEQKEHIIENVLLDAIDTKEAAERFIASSFANTLTTRTRLVDIVKQAGGWISSA